MKYEIRSISSGRVLARTGTLVDTKRRVMKSRTQVFVMKDGKSVPLNKILRSR
jgi:hypothetical protein